MIYMRATELGESESMGRLPARSSMSLGTSWTMCWTSPQNPRRVRRGCGGCRCVSPGLHPDQQAEVFRRVFCLLPPSRKRYGEGRGPIAGSLHWRRTAGTMWPVEDGQGIASQVGTQSFLARRFYRN